MRENRKNVSKDCVLILVIIYKKECSWIGVKCICKISNKGMFLDLDGGNREKSFAMDLKILLLDRDI